MVEDRNTIRRTLKRAMNGPFGFWVKYAVAMTFVMGFGAIWIGYNFWHAPTIEDQIFWGVWFIIDAVAVGFLKLWIWWQMIAVLKDRVPRDQL